MDFNFEPVPRYHIIMQSGIDYNTDLQTKIKLFSTNSLLALLDDKCADEKFYILLHSMCDLTKFEVLHTNLSTEFSLIEHYKHLFAHAIGRKHSDIVLFLLEKYNTAEYLDFILKLIINSQRINESNITILKKIITYGVDVTKNNNYAICAVSCMEDDSLEMFKLLQENGADITARSNYPIRRASNLGNLELIWHLIKSGADFRINNDYVLRNCFRYEDHNLIRFLIENGADVNNFTANDTISFIKYCEPDTIKLLLDYGLNLVIRNSGTFVSTPAQNTVIDKYNLLVDECGMDPLDFVLSIYG